jgi:hypothetical protein
MNKQEMDKNETVKKSILDEWDTIKKMKENESDANKNKPYPFNISDDRHYAIGQFVYKNLLKHKKLLNKKFTEWIISAEHMGKKFDHSENHKEKLYTLYNDLEGLMNEPFLTKSENSLESSFSDMFKKIYTPTQKSTSQAGGSISRKTKKSKKRRGTKKRM